MRGADGKFTSANQPHDDDPEFDLGDGLKLKRSALKSELGRSRNVNKLLSEAEKRAKRAEELERSHEERKKKYRDDPDALFADLGIDDEDERERWAAQWIYKKRIEPQQLTEDQRARRAAEEKLARYEAAEKEKATAAEKEKAQREATEYRENLRKELSAAIQSGKLPKSPSIIRRVAAEMARLEERGLGVDMSTVIERVKEQTRSDMAEMASTASIEELRELMGKDAFKAHLRKVLDYAKSLGRPAQQSPSNVVTLAPPAPKPAEFISPDKWASLMKGK